MCRSWPQTLFDFLMYIKSQPIHLEPVCGIFHVPCYLLLCLYLLLHLLALFCLPLLIRFSAVGSLGFCGILVNRIMEWKGLQCLSGRFIEVKVICFWEWKSAENVQRLETMRRIEDSSCLTQKIDVVISHKVKI